MISREHIIRLKRIGSTILIACGAAVPTLSQHEWTGAETPGAGARARSMAEAYGTEAGDISAMFWNPASVSSLEQQNILFSTLHTWNGQAIRGVIAVPIQVTNSSALGVGLSGTRLRIPSRQLGSLSGQHVNADIVAATDLTSTLAAGMGLQIQHVRTSHEKMLLTSFSGGLLYAPSPDISYALVYSSIGNGARIAYDTLSPSSLVIYREPLGSLLHLSIAMRFPSSRLNRVVTLVLANEKKIGESGIRYRGACEILVLRNMAWRVGYAVTPVTSGIRYGCGLTFDGFRVDYAVAPSARGLQFHELTMLIGLNAGKRTDEKEFGWRGGHDQY